MPAAQTTTPASVEQGSGGEDHQAGLRVPIPSLPLGHGRVMGGQDLGQSGIRWRHAARMRLVQRTEQEPRGHRPMIFTSAK